MAEFLVAFAQPNTLNHTDRNFQQRVFLASMSTKGNYPSRTGHNAISQRMWKFCRNSPYCVCAIKQIRHMELGVRRTPMRTMLNVTRKVSQWVPSIVALWWSRFHIWEHVKNKVNTWVKWTLVYFTSIKLRLRPHWLAYPLCGRAIESHLKYAILSWEHKLHIIAGWGRKIVSHL